MTDESNPGGLPRPLLWLLRLGTIATSLAWLAVIVAVAIIVIVAVFG